MVFTKLNWALVGCSRLNCSVLGCTGQSQQLFVCVVSHFRHGDKRPNEQPGEPSASLLLTNVRRQSFAISNRLNEDVGFTLKHRKKIAKHGAFFSQCHLLDTVPSDQ